MRRDTLSAAVLFCLSAAVGLAQADDNAGLPFDPRHVVERARAGRDVPRPLREGEMVRGGLENGEFLIDTSGVHAEHNPAVAFDGANFLVV
uniref:MBL fold metallo-hydrolase n=1 Tax=candidate division WOR-3 bacterium TaxID=2052148 RepID=A0A7C4GH63_UNCW3